MFGGQQPIKNATISVYEVGIGGYGSGSTTPLATTTTAPDGTFSFPTNAYTCDYSNAPLYITAAGGNSGYGTSNNSSIMLMSVLGPCSAAHTETVQINEVSTAVSVFALAQFFNPALGSGLAPMIGGPAAGSGVYTKGLVAAMENTVPAIFNTIDGVPRVSSTTGNVTVTTETAKLYSIANTLAICVNSPGDDGASTPDTPCGKLFNYTNVTGTKPADTVQAALMMALYPYHQVVNLYNLGTPASPFVGLASAPNDWTVALSYTNSALGVGVSGMAPRTSMSLDIDASGRVWFTSTKTGAVGVAYFDPATASFNGPYNSGLVHPQYLAIDAGGIAWASDQNSDTLLGVNTASPTSLSMLTLNGASSLGPVMVDGTNTLLTTFPDGANLGLATSGPSRSALTKNTDIASGSYTATGLADISLGYYAAAVEGPSNPCMLYDNAFSVWVQEVATGSGCVTGGMASNAVFYGQSYFYNAAVMTASTGQLCEDLDNRCTSPTVALSAPEGIAVDGNNNLWIANSGNGSVSTLGGLTSPYADVSEFLTTATVPYVHDGTHGGTLTRPYAIGVDASGNVWTISPGCVDSSNSSCTPGPMVLTEIVGAAGPTITPLQAANALSATSGSGVGAKPQS